LELGEERAQFFLDAFCFSQDIIESLYGKEEFLGRCVGHEGLMGILNLYIKAIENGTYQYCLICFICFIQFIFFDQLMSI
jgi:hypothetical protein